MTELVTVVALFSVMTAVAVPTTLNVTEALRLGSATRAFERELQSARLKAVQSNRTLRVRFNCPAEGQYRRVEFMNGAIDEAPSRCSETAHPFPSPRDADPGTPAYDGPVRYLPEGVRLGIGGRDLEFRPDGRTFLVTSAGDVQTISSSGMQVILSKGSHYAMVHVNGYGRVEIR